MLKGALAEWSTPLQSDQLNLLEHHYRLLVEANRTINLTRITDPRQAAIKHYADTLALLPALGRQGDDICTVLDIGTGAGFPALPLAVMRPSWSVTAIDGTGRKIAFLQMVVEELGLPNLKPVHAHSDHWEADRRFDLVTLRAVGRLDKNIKQAARFVGQGGCLAIYKTAAIADSELADGIKVARSQRLGARDAYGYRLQLDEETLARRIIRFERRNHE